MFRPRDEKIIMSYYKTGADKITAPLTSLDLDAFKDSVKGLFSSQPTTPTTVVTASAIPWTWIGVGAAALVAVAVMRKKKA